MRLKRLLVPAIAALGLSAVVISGSANAAPLSASGAGSADLTSQVKNAFTLVRGHMMMGGGGRMMMGGGGRPMMMGTFHRGPIGLSRPFYGRTVGVAGGWPGAYGVHRWRPGAWGVARPWGRTWAGGAWGRPGWGWRRAGWGWRRRGWGWPIGVGVGLAGWDYGWGGGWGGGGSCYWNCRSAGYGPGFCSVNAASFCGGWGGGWGWGW